MFCVCPLYVIRDSISSSLIGRSFFCSELGVAFAREGKRNRARCKLVLTVSVVSCRLHVLREPADALAVALAHDDGAHEDLDRADALERDLALASCSTSPVSMLFLAHSVLS